MTDFDAINRAALAQCPSLLKKILPGGKLQGHEYVCGNIAGGCGSSMSVNIETGKWADFAAGGGGRDLITLVAARDNLNQHEAARRLAALIGYSLPDDASPERKPAGQKEKQPAICPVPDDAPRPDFQHYRLGEPAGVFEYRNSAGQLLGMVCRFNQQERDSKGKPKKEFCPMVYTRAGWRWQGFAAPYPFYGLSNLAKTPPDAPVVVVEGEYKANVLQSITGQNMAVLGLYGGCGKVGGMDYSPLGGRRAYYWPDNDRPGFMAAMKFAENAGAVAASVKILKPPAGAKETWDAANAIEDDGWSWDNLRDWMSANRLDPDEFRPLLQESPAGSEKRRDSKPSYKPMDIFDFMTLELPERENLIAPILQTQGIALLHAQRGIGKTFAALSIAHAVASGGSLFERWDAPKPARVLYIDGEMPARAMQDRLRAICAGTQSDITDRGLFRILTPDLQEAPMPNLATHEGQEAISGHIAASDFIVIDNLATLTSYGRSNEEESWRPVQEWLLNLRRMGKSTLVIHHQGKNGTQRGTSAKEDCVDTVLSLCRPKDYRPDQGARFEVHYTKCRHVSGKDAMPFEARLSRNEDGRLTWITRTIENAELEQVRRLLDEKYSIRDIAEEMGLSKSKVERLKQKLGQQD